MEDSNANGKIPKITHRIWFQGWDKVPQKYQENVRLLEEMNPDFKHMKWDEHSLRRECEKLGDEYVKKFDSYPLLISKVDYGRYIVLYNYGGISIDMDMKSNQSLNNIPYIQEKNFLVSLMPPPFTYFKYVNNAFFAVEPNSQIMKSIIDECNKIDNKIENYPNQFHYVDLTTGGKVVNRILDTFGESVTKLAHTYVEPCFSLDYFCKCDKETVLDHKHSMSWFPWYYTIIVAIFLFLFRFIYFIFGFLILIIWIRKPKWLPSRLRIKSMFK